MLFRFPNRQVWLSLMWGHCPFPLSPGMHKVLFVPSKSLCFPQSCGSSVIRSHRYLQTWGFPVPLPDPQVGKPALGPRTFTSGRELLWYNCCQACGSPTCHSVAMVGSSDKTWSTGEGNGKPLQYSCFENPKNSMKRQKDTTPEDEPPRSVGA